ncbi:hypothetical protein ABZV50_37970, partial [Streptomyces sp. NPDC004856]
AIVVSLGIAAFVYLAVCVVLLGMQNYKDIDVALPYGSGATAFFRTGHGSWALIGRMRRPRRGNRWGHDK